MSGGPPRDGIPSIDSPKFYLAAEADWLFSNSRVIGIEIEGNNRGYPLAISNWHEIANDTICGVPVSITIYPHFGTGLAFRREFDGAVTKLGVSSLLYNIEPTAVWSVEQIHLVSSNGTSSQLPAKR